MNRRHTFVYRGSIEQNSELDVSATHFITQEGRESAVRQPKVEGLVFSFVESPNGRMVTHVDDVRLNHHVRIEQQRHLEGGGLSPSGKDIGEDAARNVLQDAVSRNGEQEAALSPKFGKLRESTR